MIHFSPCLEIFFNDLSFPERIRKISEIGYKYSSVLKSILKHSALSTQLLARKSL